MNPGAFLLLALGISAVGTLVLWARSRPRRLHMNDSIAGFKRELAALSPDRSPDAFVREHSRKRSEPSLQELLHADEADWTDHDTDVEALHSDASGADGADVGTHAPAPYEHDVVQDDVLDSVALGGAFEDTPIEPAFDEHVDAGRRDLVESGQWINASIEPDGTAPDAVDDDASAEPLGYLDELYRAADKDT